MTRSDRLRKTCWFIAILVYYLGGYVALNEFSLSRMDLHRLDLPFESRIPFLPGWIFVYGLIFPILALPYVLVEDLAYWKKLIFAFFVCVNFHFLIFLIYPVHYVLRPTVDPDHGWLHTLVHFYYWTDLPYNCFPSLHISNVFLVAFAMHRYRPNLGWIFFPLAVAVAFSVLFVKQHYVADVAAGLAVAYWADKLVIGRWKAMGWNEVKAGGGE